MSLRQFKLGRESRYSLLARPETPWLAFTTIRDFQEVRVNRTAAQYALGIHLSGRVLSLVVEFRIAPHEMAT